MNCGRCGSTNTTTREAPAMGYDGGTNIAIQCHDCQRHSRAFRPEALLDTEAANALDDARARLNRGYYEEPASWMDKAAIMLETAATGTVARMVADRLLAGGHVVCVPAVPTTAPPPATAHGEVKWVDVTFSFNGVECPPIDDAHASAMAARRARSNSGELGVRHHQDTPAYIAPDEVPLCCCVPEQCPHCQSQRATMTVVHLDVDGTATLVCGGCNGLVKARGYLAG